jgi:hypothetical protein
MSVVFIIGLSFAFLGVVCGVVADAIYQAPIQRYLENMGKKPAHLLSIGGDLDNYFSAKDVAKKWGHNPVFLKRYGKLAKTSLVLFSAGCILTFSWLLAQI